MHCTYALVNIYGKLNTMLYIMYIFIFLGRHRCPYIRDGSGCLYTVIHWKYSTGVRQRNEPANRTREVKVQTIRQAVLNILPREHATARGKHPRHFSHFVFFFFSRHPSSRMLRHMGTITPQSYAAFVGLYYFVH